MERRILDFGVNDSVESAAQRWDIQYRIRIPISSNIIRRVVDRVGTRERRRMERALPPAGLHADAGGASVAGHRWGRQHAAHP